MTAIGDVGAIPSTPSAGTIVSAARPGATVRNASRTGSSSVTPAASAASAPIETS